MSDQLNEQDLLRKAAERNAVDGAVDHVGSIGSGDDTERSLVAQRVQGSRTLIQLMAENIREVFWTVTPDWKEVLYISPAYEKIWGRSCESLYARPLDWLDAVVDADREQVIDEIRKKALEISLTLHLRSIEYSGQMAPSGGYMHVLFPSVMQKGMFIELLALLRILPSASRPKLHCVRSATSTGATSIPCRP